MSGARCNGDVKRRPPQDALVTTRPGFLCRERVCGPISACERSLRPVFRDAKLSPRCGNVPAIASKRSRAACEKRVVRAARGSVPMRRPLLRRGAKQAPRRRFSSSFVRNRRVSNEISVIVSERCFSSRIGPSRRDSSRPFLVVVYQRTVRMSTQRLLSSRCAAFRRKWTRDVWLNSSLYPNAS